MKIYMKLLWIQLELQNEFDLDEIDGIGLSDERQTLFKDLLGCGG